MGYESRGQVQSILQSVQKNHKPQQNGRRALRSHEKAEKHRLDTRLDSDQRGLESFVLPPPPPSTSTSSSSTSSDTSSSTSSHAAASGQKQMCMYFAKNDVLTSEILWTMQTVVNHNSYKSNENISELFKTEESSVSFGKL